MVLFCISLITNDIKHIFMSLLAICICYLMKCLFKDVGQILVGLTLTLSCKSSLLMSEKCHLLNKCIDSEYETIRDSLHFYFF